MVIVQQKVEFEEIYNFRDMGGLQTTDGRRVKEGLLFRCGELGHATKQDLEQLQALNIKVIFDYRDDFEAEKVPTAQIADVHNIRIPASTNLNYQSKSIEDVLKSEQWTQENALGQFYAGMLAENPSYRALITCIKERQVPLVHHCTAGKDRTGIGAALIYLLLGVSEEEIIHEYLLTNEANATKPPVWMKKMKEELKGYEKAFENMAGVKALYLETALERIKSDYGTYEAYFLQEHQLTAEDIEVIRDFYLQSA